MFTEEEHSVGEKPLCLGLLALQLKGAIRAGENIRMDR